MAGPAPHQHTKTIQYKHCGVRPQVIAELMEGAGSRRPGGGGGGASGSGGGALDRFVAAKDALHRVRVRVGWNGQEHGLKPMRPH